MKNQFRHTFLLWLMLVTAFVPFVSTSVFANDISIHQTPAAILTSETTPAPESISDGGLKIEDVKVTVTRTENSISWALNNQTATPTLEYGTNRDVLKDAGTIPKLADGSYKLTFSDLNPGTLYYFTIKAATDDNLQGASYSGVLTTRGYPVQLTVKQNGTLLPNADVKIGSRDFIANQDAVIATELNSGSFTAAITPRGAETGQNITFTVKKISIPKDNNPTLQSFVLNIATVAKTSEKDSSVLPLAFGGSIAAFVIIAGVSTVLFIINKQKQATSQSVDIDKGQLREAYGNNIEKYSMNTPEPNLGAGFSEPAVTSLINAPPTAANSITPAASPDAVDLSKQPAASSDDAPPIPAAIDTGVQAQNLEVAAADQSVTTQQQDVASPPLQQPVEQPTAEDEALVRELAKVESSDPGASTDEPSAIYDAATGELDIIHHHRRGPKTPFIGPTHQGAH